MKDKKNTTIKLVKEQAMKMKSTEFHKWFLANIDTLMQDEHDNILLFHLECTKHRIESTQIEMNEDAQTYLMNHAHDFYFKNFNIR